MFRRLLAAVAALSAAVVPVTLAATVLVPAEFREVVNGSDLIIYARVSGTEVRWSDDRKHVDTLVTLQAGTYLKGAGGPTLVVAVPGGTVGRYMNVTIGAPHFSVGDEAVFFLTTRDREMPAVFGLNQGIFRVSTAGAGGRRVVMPPLMSRADGAETVVRGDAARKPVPLETFGAQVQSVLAESGRSAR
jgi:hypothetical protein